MKKSVSIEIFLLVSSLIGVYGIDLKCSSGTSAFGWNHVSGTTYICSNMNIERKNETVTSVNGKIDFNGSSVKIIEIANQVVNYIPKGIGNFFPNIEGFRLHSSKLKSVSKEDLAQFPKLKEISLNDNELMVIEDGNLFMHNPELIHFEMNNNRLSHINGNIINSLKNLTCAYFLNNSCINKSCSAPMTQLISDIKSTCQNHYILDLLQKVKILEANLQNMTESYNTLKNECETVESTAEASLDAATRFIFLTYSNYILKAEKSPVLKCKIESTKICYVKDFSVESPDAEIPEIVDEKNEKIKENLNLIEKLVIDKQQTLFLPLNLGLKFPNLTELIITKSGYFKINSKTFSNMTLLATLRINHNKIREIQTGLFADNANLKVLDLSFNKIEIISDKAFANIINIREINLSMNLLTFIKPEVFAYLNALEILNLKSNRLESVDSGLFSGIPQLYLVDISENKIKELPGDCVAAKNHISVFVAAKNNLKLIDQKFVKRIKKAQLIDLRENDCINVIYDKNSTKVDMKSMLSEIYLECTEDEE